MKPKWNSKGHVHRQAPSGVVACLIILFVALAFAGTEATVWAQQGQGPGTPSNTDRGNEQDRPSSRNMPQGQTAQVGAGTTSGVTTDFSGPKSSTSKKPGEVSVPPLPSADLCSDYRQTDFYQQCLRVVLRTDASGQPREGSSGRSQ